MTLTEILETSPADKWGERLAFYAVGCCWWTSFPEDLAVHPSGLPCCPHCGSNLMQAPLEGFINTAREIPAHYGSGGLDTFLAAHSRNSTSCHRKWDDYLDAEKRLQAKAKESGKRRRGEWPARWA